MTQTNCQQTAAKLAQTAQRPKGQGPDANQRQLQRTLEARSNGRSTRSNK